MCWVHWGICDQFFEASLIKHTSLHPFIHKTIYENTVNVCFLSQELDEPWIGLHATRQNTLIYYYMDQQVAHYFRWDSGEPNDVETDLCVRLRPPQLLMKTLNCNTAHSFVCEKIGKH